MKFSIRKKLERYISEYLSTRVIFVMDTVLSVLASLVTIFLLYFFSSSDFFHSRSVQIVWLAASLVSTCMAFVLTKSYRIVIRHSTLKDYLVVAHAALIKAAVMLVVMIACFRYSNAIVVYSVADFFFSCVFLFLMRIIMLAAYDVMKTRMSESMKKSRVLIYGTSEKSVAASNRLAHSPHFEIAGYLERGKSNSHLKIQEKTVYHFMDDAELEDILEGHAVTGILFATESDAQEEKEDLINYASHHGIKILIAPTIDEVSRGQIMRNHVREVKIEDLLGRDEIKISMPEITETFKGKVVMVTGAAGSIGSELCRILAGLGVAQLILYDNAETPLHYLRLELEDTHKELNFVPVIGDVRLERRLDYAFRRWKPQIVFHAAAYKHVPLMEDNPCEAVLVNVAGSRYVADKCIEYGVEKMIMISTDKAVNPTNIMGCTKRLAEIYVQSLGLAVQAGEHEGHTKFITTRFGNVLGSNGSVIPRFRDQIAAGGPVTVTHPDINRFFMTIPEACRLVMEAATISTGNQIVVFDMGEPVKIDTLARRMIELAGFRPDVDIKVEYSGLRPGEKLYEEVLSNAENTEPTSHKRIRVAKVRKYEYADAKAAMDELETLARAVDIPEMVKLMKRTVPEFKSKNSPYEIYDKQ